MSLTAIIILIGLAFAVIAVGGPLLRGVFGAMLKHPGIAALVILVGLTVYAFASGVL